MNDSVRRTILFLFLCVPVRLMLVYSALKLPDKYIHIFSYVIGMIGLFTFYLWVTDGRMKGFFNSGGDAWWSSFRLIHAMLYLSAFMYLIKKNNRINAAVSLFIDVIIGICVYFSLNTP